MGTADLDTLRAQHPATWNRLSEELLASLSKRDPAATARWLESVKSQARVWRTRVAQSRSNPKVVESAQPHLLRERMAMLALQQTATALATRQTEGTVRLGLWSGAVIQRLLFTTGLERKPVSMRAFRFWWRFVVDRALLMPLVQPRGIYCFYSREFVEAVRTLIAGRETLELAAGDGTLSRFLGIRGTDDGSWADVKSGANVERIDARAALRKYAPRVVVCSWPPAGNSFERVVFETPSVETYVAVASRHHFASGDVATWARQKSFEVRLDEGLSALVLPPELSPAVFVFERVRR